MTTKQRPLFLERGSYRRRRLLDALKLLVFFGIVLWMIPALWPNGSRPDVEPMPTSHALFYIFGVWLLLIGLAVFFQLYQRDQTINPSTSDPPA